MAYARTFAGLLVGVAIGAAGGWFIASQQARVAVLSGPYSDNFGPALSAIADAKAKLRVGDTNVWEQLQAADAQIRAAQSWSQRFLGQEKIVFVPERVVSTMPQSSPPASATVVVDEVRAIAIARQAVATNDTWVDRAIFKATPEGSGWSVWVWREPRTPGGDRTVLIDEKGRVTAYYRGR